MDIARKVLKTNEAYYFLVRPCNMVLLVSSVQMCLHCPQKIAR